MDQIPAQESSQPSVLNELPSKPTQKGLKSIGLIGLVVVFLLILVGLLGYFYLKSSETLETTKGKKWIGVLSTEEGLVKISPEGELEKDNNIKVIATPWTETDKVSRLKLLKNGQIVFTAQPEDSSKYKENVIYSWSIDLPNPAKDFFTADGSKKIGSFAISPDYKQVALISYSRSESELYEGLETQDQDELKKTLSEREKQFQEELRTISVYDISSGKLIKSVKLDLLDSPSRRTGAPGLEWNKNRLFARDISKITVFNNDSWQSISIIKNDESATGPLQSKSVIISSDGTSYYDATNLGARGIPENNLIAKLNAPEFISPEQVNDRGDLEKQIVFVGPATFSPDSKKVIIQGRSVRGTNFMVWELDLASNKTKKIGESEITASRSVSGVKSLFLFLTYNPSANRIIFATSNDRGNEIGPSDLFSLKLGEKKATFINSFEGFVFFLGWYISG